MNNLLQILLAAADDIGRVFDYATTISWPAGALERLKALGILRQSTAGMYAPCPNCDDHHVERVTWSIREGPKCPAHCLFMLLDGNNV